MALLSLSFAAFALAVLIGVLIAPRRLRWLLLLVASYAYYATWSPYLPVALGAVTLLSFWGGVVYQGGAEPSGRRTAALYAGAVAAVGSLLVLKYTGFIASTATSAAALFGGPPAHTLLNPFVSIGVSYWTLQVISYAVDVSQGVIPAERHLGRFALYLAFLPKMLQGPIERPGHFLPQAQGSPPLRATDVFGPLPLILWGVFQKAVVADRIAPFVDVVFGEPARYGGLPAFVATYLFAAQIYFDFAGYTCIAIGLGRAFGIRLSRNFDAPYLAASVSEFWRRWHISFSSWILDYIFRPLQLGLRRWRTFGTPVALFVTFGFSGLWHGATWGFVAWGVLHGIYLSTSVLLAGIRKKARSVSGRSRLSRPLHVLLTFNLVAIAWVFFRAASVREATFVLVHALTALPQSLAALAQGGAGHVLLLDQGRDRFLFVLGLVGAATILPRFLPELRTTETPRADAPTRWYAPWARTIAYAAMLYCVAFLGTSTQAFIYTQF